MFKPTMLAALLALSPAAKATLVDLGNGVVYDDRSTLSWLKDVAYAKTSGASADGTLAWQAAMDWAANLSFAGADDWRLPSALNADGTGPTDFGGTSELAQLYLRYGIYAGNTGGTGYQPGPFENFPVRDGYYDSVALWTGTAASATQAWNYVSAGPGAYANYQEGFNPQDSNKWVWVVRDGMTPAVPEPGSWLLMGMGLGAIAWRVRRRCAV